MRSVAVRIRRGVLHTLRRFHPDRETVLAEFDARFYLRNNPDVARVGVDPVEHFLTRGWREGRDPSRDFSVKEYLEACPDVAEAGVNPFVHYLRAGRAEGRSPRQNLGFRYEILSNLRTVDERVAEAAKASAGVRPSEAGELTRALATSRAGLKGLHLTFSHDDYSANLGGVQLCLQREAAAVQRAGRDHLHLYPATPWPVLRIKEPALLGVVWNGKAVGAFPAAVIVEALAGRVTGGSFAIHSLLGHSVKETLAVLAAAGLKAGYFWLHDFASLCAGFHLLRDDVEDCAAPPPASAACGVCVYGPWRARHLAEHERLFKKLALTVVSPSQPTLDLWRASWTFPAKGEVVLPHARLVDRGPAPVPRGPLRVAFVGLPAAHKGWPVFRELALRFAEDRRYEFHHFGAQAPAAVPAAFHAVSANGYEPRAMQKALEAAQIDVALIWPLCRETFSFTAHETVAAGAAVVTNPDSGNVAAFVTEGGHGRVLTDERALASAFETGDIGELARARRGARLYDLEFSALTMDLIDTQAGEGRRVKVLCYSSFTFSYLNRARVLFQTLRRFHPDWELVALITDRPPQGFRFDPKAEPFDRVVWAQDLKIPQFEGWLFKHDVVEVCTAVKGPFLHQACSWGADVVMYLDPDTALFASLDPLIEMLQADDILLTPHLIDANDDPAAIADNDLSASRTGIFNLGFVAIRTTGEGARFAKWWNDRLLDYCYDDMPNGLFVDQRWCDHVPALFDKVKVVRDPGYNVASWNLSKRTVAVQKDGAITVNGSPLRFWHFTKLGPLGDVMTKKYAGPNFPVYEIWGWYKRQVTAATDAAIPARWWAYDSYADGAPIEKPQRVLYRQRGDLQAAYPDPFAAGPGSYRQWLQDEGQ